MEYAIEQSSIGGFGRMSARHGQSRAKAPPDHYLFLPDEWASGKQPPPPLLLSFRSWPFDVLLYVVGAVVYFALFMIIILFVSNNNNIGKILICMLLWWTLSLENRIAIKVGALFAVEWVDG